MTSGPAKKKSMGEGKEDAGYKTHEEHKEAELSGEKARKKERDVKFKEATSDDKNTDFKTPDESTVKQSNARPETQDEKVSEVEIVTNST